MSEDLGVTMGKDSVRKWFKNLGGKEIADTTSPFLTDANVQERLAWACRVIERYEDENSEVRRAFLWCRQLLLTLETAQDIWIHMDEKWFYPFSGRIKRKCLPRQKGEAEFREIEGSGGKKRRIGVAEQRKIKSRRFLEKIMVMGFVGKPNADYDFNGVLHLERITRPVKVNNTTSVSTLSNNIKRHDEIFKTWKNNLTKDMTGEEMITLVKKTFPELAGKTLQIKVHAMKPVNHHKGGQSLEPVLLHLDGGQKLGEKKKPLKMTGWTKNMTSTADELFRDMGLYVVEREAGKMVEEDCTCDSEWMRDFFVNRFPGIVTRQFGPWRGDGGGGGVRGGRGRGRGGANSQAGGLGRPKIFLQMDNASGHGRQGVVEEYTSELAKHGIMVVFQPKNSPETNMLDLGVWMSVQNDVDKMSREQRSNLGALWETIQKAWKKFGDEKQDKNVNIWNRVLTNAKICVVEKGANTSFEARKGYKTQLLKEFDNIQERMRLGKEGEN